MYIHTYTNVIIKIKTTWKLIKMIKYIITLEDLEEKGKARTNNGVKKRKQQKTVTRYQKSLKNKTQILKNHY